MGVLLVQPRARASSGFTPEGERVLDWARRIVGDTRAMRAGDQRAAARPHRPPADRRDPDRAGDGGEPHDAVPRSVIRTCISRILSRTSIEILTQLENLEIDAGLTYLDNEPLGRVNSRAALSRALPAADLGGRAARRPQER